MRENELLENNFFLAAVSILFWVIVITGSLYKIFFQ